MTAAVDRDRSEARELLTSAAAGGALGLFVGMMLGFSVGGLAKDVLGAVLAVTAAYFGLSAKSLPSAGASSDVRIISFCAVAVVATLLALTARTHDVLSPTWPDAVDRAAPDYRSSVLFSATGQDCTELARARARPVPDALTFLKSVGGQLAALAGRVEALPAGEREGALRAVGLVLCGA